MKLNGQNALCCRKESTFGAHCTNLNETKKIMAAAVEAKIIKTSDKTDFLIYDLYSQLSD